MIQKVQKNKVINNIIKSFYLKGRIPKVKDIINSITTNYSNRSFGSPFFIPKLALIGSSRKAEDIKNNFVQVSDDFDTLSQSISILNLMYNNLSGYSNNKYLAQKQKLIELGEKLNYLTDKESQGTIGSFYDTFRNTNSIELLSSNGIYIDTKLGEVILAPSKNTTYKLDPSNIVVVDEIQPIGFKVISGNVLDGFNSLSTNYYQVLLNNTSYSFIVNLTNKNVIKGTTNEINLNRITIDPIASVELLIEYSTDKLNWYTIASSNIVGYTSFDFSPIWALFVRFTFKGNGSVGYRNISFYNLDTCSYGELYSTQFVSTYPMFQLNFNYNQNTPYGTSIKHYISTQPENGWIQINPGEFYFGPNTYNTISISSSSNFVADNANNPSTMYSYSLSGNPVPIYSSGELLRGYGQFLVESFGFDYSAYAEPNHIPRLEDWDNPLGHVSSCYMLSNGNSTTVSFPSTGTSSFLYTYSNSTQTYWGASCQVRSSGGGSNVPLLVNNYNYKLTTYLYSDRNILLNNFGGGIYIKDPSNPTGSPTGVVSSATVGWSMYVNSQRVASDNKYYSPTNIPGSGSMTSSDGLSFPVNLKQGWNKIEVLIYIPSQKYFDTNLVNGWNIMLLFRPNLFNFTLDSSNSFSYAPVGNEYPIWADGNSMNKVSEFYLETITKPLDNSSWAWKIDPTSGTVSSFILNYNPLSPAGVLTIDGRYKGSYPNFLLKYNYNNTNFNSFYYKAVFSRTAQSTQSPKLSSYRFIVLQ